MAKSDFTHTLQIDGASSRLNRLHAAAMAVSDALYGYVSSQRSAIEQLDDDTVPDLALHLRHLIDEMHAAGCDIAASAAEKFRREAANG